MQYSKCSTKKSKIKMNNVPCFCRYKHNFALNLRYCYPYGSNSIKYVVIHALSNYNAIRRDPGVAGGAYRFQGHR